MKVELIENRAWEFVDGRIVRHEKGTSVELENEEAERMIDDGCAVEANRSDREERKAFWREFSKSDLQETCRKHISEYMPSIHRNVADLIGLILDYEARHGSLPKENDVKR